VAGTDVYEAYVVEHQRLPGLSAIYSPPPIQQVTLNWLNVFYAVEWAVFAGFALYFWYRVVKDAKEREDEDRALELEGSRSDPAPSEPASEGTQPTTIDENVD